ncbi:Uncharacterised protein [Bordetella pertussis]|nr:Uncharacterised protein [Bordetella pertussis]CFW38726.1 Uncharacterised protein [Bordetella pertussis]
MPRACSGDSRSTTGPRCGMTTIRPSDSSWRSASRTRVRLTPVISQSSRSGRRSPGRNRPTRMALRMLSVTLWRSTEATRWTLNSPSGAAGDVMRFVLQNGKGIRCVRAHRTPLDGLRSVRGALAERRAHAIEIGRAIEPDLLGALVPRLVGRTDILLLH